MALMLSGIQQKYLPFLEEMQLRARGTAVENKWHQLFVAVLTPGKELSVEKLEAIAKQLEEVKSLYDTKVQHSVQHTERSERIEILAEGGDNPATSATSTECFHVDEFPAAPIKQVEKQSLVEQLPVFHTPKHTPVWREHSYARVSSSFYETVSGRRSVDSESEEDDIDDSLRLVIDESANPVDTNERIETEEITPDVESAIVDPPSQAPPAPAATVEPPVDIAIGESPSYPVSKDIQTLVVLELITALDDRIAQKEKQENLKKPLKSKDELAGKTAMEAASGNNTLTTKRRAGSNSRFEAENKSMNDVFAKKPKLEASKKIVLEKETPQHFKRMQTRPADDPEDFKQRSEVGRSANTTKCSVPDPPVLEQQLWIYRSICNIAFAKSRRGFIFKCLIPGCRFQSLVKDHLQVHLKEKHEKHDWNGFCNICMDIVDRSTNGNRMIDEFRHLEGHVNAYDADTYTIQPPHQPHALPPTVQSQLPTSEDSIISTLKKLPPSIIVKQVPKPKNLIPAVVVEKETVAQDAPEITPSTKMKPKLTQSFVQLNMLQPWLKSGSVNIKSDLLVLSMQSQICLSATYKCMSSTCCFFTTEANVFRKHIALHLKSTFFDKKNFLMCANCVFQGLTSEHLIRHVDTVHVYDRFQCNYCFYRSSSDFNVLTHQKTIHKAKKILVIDCPERKPRNNQAEIDEATKSWKRNVPPIVCIFCRGIFFVVEHFKQHLTTHDAKMRSRCIKCGDTATKETLCNHLKCHGLGLFHCIHCVFGTDKFELLKEHIANDHPSKISMYCKRTEMRPVDESSSPSSVLATCLQEMKHAINKNFIINAPTDEEVMRNVVNIEKLKADVNDPLSDDSEMPRNFQFLKPTIALKKHRIVAQMPDMVASSSKSSIMSNLLKPI